MWVWKDGIQPYTIAVDDEKACETLRNELINNESTIASGLFYPWSEPIINMFDMLVIIETDDEVRKQRIIKREYELYGNRSKKGGDMYEQFNKYLDWAMEYDYSNDKLGSKEETRKWANKFKGKILYLDGNGEIEENINIVLKIVKENNSRRSK